MRPRKLKSYRLPIAPGPDPQPPRLYIDTPIPEALFRSRNCHGHWSGNIEIDKIVVRRRVRYVHWLSVDSHGEVVGSVFRGTGTGCTREAAKAALQSAKTATVSTRERRNNSDLENKVWTSQL